MAGDVTMSHDVAAKPATILVVEDDPDIRAITTLQLRDGGFTVSIATNGEEALELVRTVTPDLVLLDLMLPGLDGYTICREIRQQSEVPVVIMSGRPREQDRVRAFEVGADGYLTKPVGRDELLARVRTGLRRPRLGDRPVIPGPT